jgi:alginate O-acetyltransferase complex protein AlgI
LGGIADQIFSINSNELPTTVAWVGIFAYSLQIYFDFSGYSCMAIGLGKMFGFEFSENFNYPYISTSIKEFWRRWHISLSTWFRDYLYIPLGGSKGSGFKTYRNLFIVFSLCGLWHGASWNFLIWGLFHGFFLSIERIGVEKWLNNLPKFFRHFYVLFFVSISWVFFRAETLSGSLEYLKSLFIYRTSDIYILREFLQPDVVIAFSMGILFSTPLSPKFLNFSKSMHSRLLFLIKITYMLALFTLFLFSVMYLSSGSFNPFIYFRF